MRHSPCLTRAITNINDTQIAIDRHIYYMLILVFFSWTVTFRRNIYDFVSGWKQFNCMYVFIDEKIIPPFLRTGRDNYTLKVDRYYIKCVCRSLHCLFFCPSFCYCYDVSKVATAYAPAMERCITVMLNRLHTATRLDCPNKVGILWILTVSELQGEDPM